MLAAAAVVTMSGCAGENKLNLSGKALPDASLQLFVVTFPNSSKVDCLLLNGWKSASIECAFGKRSVATETRKGMVGTFEQIAGEEVRCVSYGSDTKLSMDCDLEKTGP